MNKSKLAVANLHFCLEGRGNHEKPFTVDFIYFICLGKDVVVNVEASQIVSAGKYSPVACSERRGKWLMASTIAPELRNLPMLLAAIAHPALGLLLWRFHLHQIHALNLLVPYGV